MASSIDIEGRKLDLFDTNDVAVNFQVFDLGQLGSNQVGYTNKFSLPKTANNLDILENVHRPNTSALPGTRSPEYILNIASLLIDGYLLLPKACMRIVTTSSTIDISIQDGAAAFYRTASGIKLNDPINFDWSYLNFKYENVWSMLPSVITDIITFPMHGTENIIYVDDNDDWHYDTLIVNEMYPSIRVDEIIKQIEQYTGYTMVGLTINANSTLSLPSIGAVQGGPDPLVANGYDIQNFNYSDGALNYEMTSFIDNDSTGQWQGDHYIVPSDGFYEVQFNGLIGDIQEGDQGDILETIMPDGSIHTVTAIPGNALLYSATVYRVEGSTIEITGRNTTSLSTTPIPVINRGIKLVLIDDFTYHVDNALPDWTLLEFIRELATMYGYIISVDEVSKEVNFTTLKVINKLKYKAVDLSRRAFVGEPKLSYMANGYFKSSSFKFSGDYPMSANLSHANEWAEATGDVWSSKSYGIKHIKYEVRKSDNPYTFGYVRIGAGADMSYWFYDDEGVKTVYNAPNTATNLHVWKNDWAYRLAIYYPEMNNMLLSWLQVDIPLFLSPSDINKLTNLVPIYWDNQYWYVNKISNYKVGNPCTISLVRLQEGAGSSIAPSIGSYKFHFLAAQGKSGMYTVDSPITLTQEISSTGEVYNIIINESIESLPVSLTVGDVVYLDRTSAIEQVGYVELGE